MTIKSISAEESSLEESAGQEQKGIIFQAV